MTMMLKTDDNYDDKDYDDDVNYKSNFFESSSKVPLSHAENIPPSPLMNCYHILVFVFIETSR